MIALAVAYALIFTGAAGLVWSVWKAAGEQDRDRAAVFIARDRAARDAGSSPHAPTVNPDRT